MKGKGKAPSCGSKERFLHVPESVNDVYDFDQMDASRNSSANSEELIAEFRSPRHIKSHTRALRKCAENKMLYSANDVIEASQSGKTSTPCAVTGHQKTKKKILGTPAPWVVLSRLQQNSFAVSPIAVEHHSPNDLSRQIDVNSMFGDTSVLDDSAISSPKSQFDNVGSEWNDKIPVAASDKVPFDAQFMTEEAIGQEYNSDKHKSETDSGYPKFDSQCEFISLCAGNNIGTATERIDVSPDDLRKVNLPVQQNVDSRNNQNILPSLKTSSKNKLTDYDCEVVFYKSGTLDPEKFNSSAARSSRKLTAKRRHRDFDDVEPTDSSDDSNAGAGVSSDVKIKNLVKGKLKQSDEDVTSLPGKQSRALKTRNAIVDSALSACSAPSIKYSRKTDSKTESAEVPSVKSLHVKKLEAADLENTDMLEKQKSRRKPTKKQNAESGSKKQTKDARIKEIANGPDSEAGDADCKWLTLLQLHTRLYRSSRCSRDRAAGCISFGQKWKTGTVRQYFTDIIGLSSTTVR